MLVRSRLRICQCMDRNEQIGGFGSGLGWEAAPGWSRCWRRTSANNRWQQRRLRRLAAGRRVDVTSAARAGGHVAPGPQAAPAARRATSANSNVSCHSTFREDA
jgi:hypothetical protein